MAYYFVAQKFRIRLFQSETIVFFFSAPVFQCDDQIDILCLPDALHTKHGLHIYDSNTTKLDKMSGDIRCRTNQRIIADLTDLYHVICYQTMSSLDQLQRCLALTDSTLSHNQYTDTIHIHKYSVNGNTRCQFHIHPANQLRHERGC